MRVKNIIAYCLNLIFYPEIIGKKGHNGGLEAYKTYKNKGKPCSFSAFRNY